MFKLEHEYTCSVCQCTYIDKTDNHTSRCGAHRNLSEKIEEEVKYIHKDITNTELADRLTALEKRVEVLEALNDKTMYHKVCEDCKQEFEATAPATKKCPKCKGKAK